MSRKSRQSVPAVNKATAEKVNKPNYHRWLIAGGILAVISLITVGVLAERGIIGGKNNASSTSASANLGAPNPVAPPLPSATPQLSKEYIYAGSRMLAVEDANAPHSSYQPADLVVWRLTGGTGYWYIKDSKEGTISSGIFGGTNDKPVPADFDGDGLYDFCVFRKNTPSAGLATWYIQPSSGGSFYGVQFGLASDTSSDTPVPADYDGDGRADIAVWRSTDAKYYILKSSTSTLQITAIGQTGGTPLPADYDGDGRADAAVYNLVNNVYVWTIAGQTDPVSWGDPPNGDKPVTGDFDGDGRFDVAVRRDGSNQWIVRNVGTLSMSISGFAMQSTDWTVAGDYDGDGKTDAAVWRPSNGTWYIRQSRNGEMRQDAWGANGDTPVPAPFWR